MKKFLLAMFLIVTPAWAQIQMTPKDGKKSATARVDNCAPIGRTAKGEMVFSMKCDNVPAPSPPTPQAEVAPAPPPEPDVQRSGVFGWSYDRR